ncbi:MAG: transposase, partial [Dethiobacter sp.]
MFKENPNSGQMNIMNPYNSYPQYIKDALHKSWAPYFRQYLFHKIDEQRFSVLYSNKASRPNTPVNILVGLFFLKELCGWTDEEMIGA